MTQQDEATYTIDQLAAHTGVPSRTIRFYQSRGALPAPVRRGRKAYYGPTHVERLELIALNSRTTDATFAFLAGTPFKKIVDITSGNQERLLRYPDIVDALGANPLTGRAVIDRILSHLGIETIDTTAAPARAPPQAELWPDD